VRRACTAACLKTSQLYEFNQNASYLSEKLRYRLDTLAYDCVVPKPRGNLGEPTSAVVRPILEFPRGQGINGSCSRKPEAS